jgi:hypothetical protein
MQRDHGAGMQVNATIKLVLFGVESHQVSSFSSRVFPSPSIPCGMRRREPPYVSRCCSRRRTAARLSLNVCARQGTARARCKSSCQVFAEPKARSRARASTVRWGLEEAQSTRAGRRTLTTAGKPAAGRTRQGAGDAGPSVRLLRRRREHRRAESTGGGTGDGECEAFSGAQASAQGQRDQERGRPAMEPYVPRRHVHQTPIASASGERQGPEGMPTGRAPVDVADAWGLAGARRGGPAAVPRWVIGLLWLRRSGVQLQGAGLLDPASAALRPVEAEEGKGATWMFEDGYAKHRHWHKLEYKNIDLKQLWPI